MGLSRTFAALAAIAVAAFGPDAAPGAEAGAVTFAAEDGVAAVPFENLGGLVVLPVTIGASKPLRFVLDSGAGRMVLDRAVADELGLAREGSGYVMGAGAGALRVEYVRDVTLGPDGVHIMFTSPKAPLREGGKLPVTLTFEKAGTVEAFLDVLAIGAKGPETDQGGMNMKMTQ